MNENRIKKKMKASVIIPVFNEDKYLEKCIDSILHQTIQDM
jgi:glycosyltransferase involved in cell wall biosynthesis